MNVEELLKSISDMLKKNEKFFEENPELFKAVQDRFYKAMDDEYGDEEEYVDDPYGDEENPLEDEEDFYNIGYDEAGISDLFDDIPEEDVDENQDGTMSEQEADEFLEDNYDVIDDAEDLDGDGDIDFTPAQRVQIQENDDVSDEEYASQTQNLKEGKSSSKMMDWKPQDGYAMHHQELIDKFLDVGFSHREAERLANASPFTGHPSESNIKGSNPSMKMLAILKPLASKSLRDAAFQQDTDANPERNPIRAARARIQHAQNDAYSNFDDALEGFLGLDHIKDLKGMDRMKALREWEKQFHELNPEDLDIMSGVADAHKNTITETHDARQKFLQEQEEALLDATKMKDTEGFSTALSNLQGETGGMTEQGIAEAVGGQKTEQGFSTNVKKDPFTLFHEQKPEFMEQLKQQKKQKELEATKKKLEQAMKHKDHSEVSKRYSIASKPSVDVKDTKAKLDAIKNKFKSPEGGTE